MLLNRFARPQNSRDRLTIARVARELKGLLLIPAGGIIAGAYGLTTWNSRMGHVLVEIAAAAIVVGLVHAGVTVRRLQREMAYRALCRGNRLVLPAVLADGITAAEREDASKTAEAISIRISKMKDFSDQSIAVFDVLMFDILESCPTLSKELRQIARAAQKKA